MLQLKLGLSLATDLSFTRTNVIQLICASEVSEPRVCTFPDQVLQFKNKANLQQKCSKMVTILFDFGLKSGLFGKKGLRMVWSSTKKENICSVTTETQNRHELYMLIELLFSFNVPPRKWQLRVNNSCVLKSGTKMRLLSNSATGHRSQRGQHLCIHKLKILQA